MAEGFADPGRSPAIPGKVAEQHAMLRETLIPWLAPETGVPMRRVARLAEIPGE